MLTPEQVEALNLLSKRRNPKTLKWFRLIPHPPYHAGFSSPEYECCICYKLIWYAEVKEHGVYHLRQHGLLVLS